MTLLLCLFLLVLPHSGHAEEQPAEIFSGIRYGVLLEPLSDGITAVCAVNTLDKGAQWFLLKAQGSMNEFLGTIETAFYMVSSIKASPDDRYLAVLSVGEGHPLVEVIDLPQLLSQHQYTVLHTINPYPGVAYLKGWQGTELQIASDMLLTRRDPATGDVPEEFMLVDDEVFGLDVVTGVIRGVSEGAKNPAKNYSRILMDHQADESKKAQALTGLLGLEQHDLAVEELFKIIEHEDDAERIIKLLEIVEELRQQAASQ